MSEDAIKQFLRDLMDPEVFGFAVTQEVRDEAMRLLGILSHDSHRS